MKSIEGNSLIIIGAGVSGLFAAAVFSKFYKKVVVLERASSAIHQKQIEARDRHAHVCVAGALKTYMNLIPGFHERLKKNGFFIGDPGIEIKWSTVNSSLAKTETNSLSGYGSYKAFWTTIIETVFEKNNVEIIYGVSELKVNSSANEIIWKNSDTVTTSRYDVMIVANGSPGRENAFLKENQINYETQTFSGYCCYHSFDVKLDSPLSKDVAFISEAKPGYKDLSLLYVPREATQGILTVGNFGNPLEVNRLNDLVSPLETWKHLLPNDFLSKLNEVSKQTDFRSNEIWWHKISPNNSKNIFLIGDALLRVPPYTGLGFAVAASSIESLIMHLKQISAGLQSDFNLIFREKADEVFIRIKRYEKEWGRKLGSKEVIRPQKRTFSLTQFVSRKIAEFIFHEAEVKQSKIASQYLIRRFHLAQDSSFVGLIQTLIKIKFTQLFDIPGRSHEELSKSSR